MINLYPLIRPWAFKLDAESSHDWTLTLLKHLQRQRLIHRLMPPLPTKAHPSQPIKTCGIQVKHAVGLAAGLDKNGDVIDAMGNLGFSFIEVGTVTPKPQSGNPKPRLFRLAEHQAIINRMGFNNRGVDYLVNNLKRCRFQGQGAIGVNIGKSKSTPNDQAIQDYLVGLTRAYPYTDYFTINISSPNTPGLRALQDKHALQSLLEKLQLTSDQLAKAQGQPKKPIWLKISPDLSEEALEDIVNLAKTYELAALVVTNTTLNRMNIEHKNAQEAGGLSGAPLFEQSNQMIRQIRAMAGDSLGIVGVGGIVSASDAVQKIQAGANLVQIYSGLIYHGHKLVRDCVRALNTDTFSEKT